jgi:O-acetylhomoserine/O-acetylserine sulfhydrylase-like pyridoxal-dependent enzyme
MVSTRCNPCRRRARSATGARQVPIYQTTAYVFKDADHAARLFNLQEVGYIYSRLTNPTVAALANRVAALEGGAGGICCSSGHAAQIMALFPLMGPGKNIIASTRLYGGTITQFSQTIKRFRLVGEIRRLPTICRPSRPPSTTTPAPSSARPSPTPAAMSPTFRRWPGSPISRAFR